MLTIFIVTNINSDNILPYHNANNINAIYISIKCLFIVTQTNLLFYLTRPFIVTQCNNET